MYGLTSQIRRCSASMGANIAEGCGKEGNRELYRFLQIASGSASVLDYHLLHTRDLSYMAQADYQRVNEELLEFRRMLAASLKKLGATAL